MNREARERRAFRLEREERRYSVEDRESQEK